MNVFAKYQLTEWLPWFFRRYVLFQKSATVRPPPIGDGLDGSGDITDLTLQGKTSPV